MEKIIYFCFSQIIKHAGPHVAKSGVSVKDVDKDKAAADGVDQVSSNWGWGAVVTHKTMFGVG